jgi:hypothetical protein
LASTLAVTNTEASENSTTVVSADAVGLTQQTDREPQAPRRINVMSPLQRTPDHRPQT